MYHLNIFKTNMYFFKLCKENLLFTIYQLHSKCYTVYILLVFLFFFWIVFLGASLALTQKRVQKPVMERWCPKRQARQSKRNCRQWMCMFLPWSKTWWTLSGTSYRLVVFFLLLNISFQIIWVLNNIFSYFSCWTVTSPASKKVSGTWTLQNQ